MKKVMRLFMVSLKLSIAGILTGRKSRDKIPSFLGNWKLGVCMCGACFAVQPVTVAIPAMKFLIIALSLSTKTFTYPLWFDARQPYSKVHKSE